ncbi:hypothetical protein FACS1894132_14580 [Clostridia bacterium]|nr:hypothetical protein FACS1894132_14580 [Clostridia bacterium]
MPLILILSLETESVPVVSKPTPPDSISKEPPVIIRLGVPIMLSSITAFMPDFADFI